METQFDLLTADHESLIQENLALRTLNEASNEAQEAAAAESSRADQQVLDLEQTVNSLNQSASSLRDERLQLLAQVDQLEKIQEEEAIKLSEQFDENNAELEKALQQQQEQSEAIVQLTERLEKIQEEEAIKLSEQFDENNAELEKALQQQQEQSEAIVQLTERLEKIQEEEAIKLSEQFDENNAELEKALQQQQEQSEAIVQLTEQLEQVLEMSNDTMEDLQPATDSDSEVSEVADTSMETTSAEAVAESPQADQQVLDLEQTVNNLNQSVDNLQNERHQLLAQVDQLTTQLENLLQLASQSEIAVSDTTTMGESAPEQTVQTETAETMTQTSAEETSELAASLDELNSEVLASLKESVSSLQNERLQLLSRVDHLTAQLDSQSQLANQSETVASDTTTKEESASEQTAQTENAETTIQTQPEESSELAASLDELYGGMVESLKESVYNLQNERQQLLAQVAQLEKIQEEEAIRLSEQFDENNAELEKALQQQQEQSEAIVQLTEQLEQVLEMSNDTMEDLQPATDSDSEVSEVADTSMETTSAEAVAESPRADQQVLDLEQTVNNLNQSVGSLQNERHQLLAQVDHLTAQLENLLQLASQSEIAVSDTTTMGESAPEQTAQTETAETMTQTSAEETSELAASLDELNSEVVASLKEFVSGLQNQLQTTHNEVDRLALQLASSESRTKYLGTRLRYASKHLGRHRAKKRESEVKSERRTRYLATRLRYASKHLGRHRAKKRESEVKSENLVMERQVLQEDLSELSSTLDQSIAENQTEMALLVSKFSVIRLESDVIFDSGSAKLSTQGLETLRDIAQKYQDYPDRIMSIEGHTDNKLIAGNLARFYPTNWELSAARAAAAANFLTQQGVPEDKLRIVGFGALQPIASNDTEEGRAANRRIEIRLAPKLSEAETN